MVVVRVIPGILNLGLRSVLPPSAPVSLRLSVSYSERPVPFSLFQSAPLGLRKQPVGPKPPPGGGPIIAPAILAPRWLRPERMASHSHFLRPGSAHAPNLLERSRRESVADISRLVCRAAPVLRFPAAANRNDFLRSRNFFSLTPFASRQVFRLKPAENCSVRSRPPLGAASACTDGKPSELSQT